VLCEDTHGVSGSERGFPDSAVGTRSLVGGIPSTAWRLYIAPAPMEVTLTRLAAGYSRRTVRQLLGCLSEHHPDVVPTTLSAS
jgi:hypothetical protein